MKTLMRCLLTAIFASVAMPLILSCPGAHFGARSFAASGVTLHGATPPGRTPDANRIAWMMRMRGLPTEGWSATAQLDKPVVARGELAYLKLKLEHIGKRTQFLPIGSPERITTIIVQDSRGNVLPLKDTYESPGLTDRQVEVQPGGGDMFGCSLNNMFDISRPGVYAITASHKVPLLNGKGMTDVVANTVTLTVTQNAPPEPVTTARPSAWGGLISARMDGDAWRRSILKQAGLVSEGFQLTASLAKREVVTRESAPLTLTLQNLNREVRKIILSHPGVNFRVIVEGPGARVLSPKKQPLILGARQRKIDPGEALRFTYALDETYDLSAVGDYRITAVSRVPQLDGKGWTYVVSNTVVLTVVAPPPQGGKLPAP